MPPDEGALDIKGTISERFMDRERNKKEEKYAIFSKYEKKFMDVEENYKSKNFELSNDVLNDKRITWGKVDEKLNDYYKVLRTQLIQKMLHEKKRTLLITSAVAGEGKTMTALNLAISFSKVIGVYVTLVEADLKRPALKKYLGFDGKEIKGMADYFLDDVDVRDLMICPRIPKLDILFAGRSIPESAELLGSKKMKVLIEKLLGKNENQILIFDMTSVLEYPDALVLTDFINTVLFVVAANSTPITKIKDAKRKILDKDIIGSVLNKAVLIND